MPQQQTALITGGTSGIGLALAREFARRGYNLIIAARKPDELAKVKLELERQYKISVQTVSCDLSRTDGVRTISSELKNTDINVLVNNAGFGAKGSFAETSLDVELSMIQLNIVALTSLTKLFLHGMIARGSGIILHVASTAAFEPGPFMAVYFATKAYVLSLSEALGEELRGTGVTVTALCPGPTQTGFAAAARTLGRGVFSGQLHTAAEVARIGVGGALQGKRVVITGAKNKALIFLTRLSPRAITARVTRYMINK